MDAQKIRARDAAVARLRRVTTASAGAAGVLALVVTGIAAKAFPGRSSQAATTATKTTRVAAQRPATQTPPPLVSNGSPTQTPSAPAAPSAPTPTAAPPVAVSGGS